MNDLYGTLGVKKSASKVELKKAYRKLALSYHPDKVAAADKEASEQIFKDIAEAYSILSNDELRERYDKDGFDGLNAPKGGSNAPKYDSREVFQSFFGDNNPFAYFGFNDSTDFRSRKNSDQQKEKILEEHHDLSCTLEELYSGAEKVVKITRNRYSISENNFLEESKILRVSLRGVAVGEKVKFEGEADETKFKRGDLYFTIIQELHDKFEREGNNLVHLEQITLLQALTGKTTVNITTLSGKKLTLPCPEVIHPTYERKIIGEGMPCASKTSKKGDLIIRFKIEFPKALSFSVKNRLQALLADPKQGDY